VDCRQSVNQQLNSFLTIQFLPPLHPLVSASSELAAVLGCEEDTGTWSCKYRWGGVGGRGWVLGTAADVTTPYHL
jgi:hypothetical protein